MNEAQMTAKLQLELHGDKVVAQGVDGARQSFDRLSGEMNDTAAASRRMESANESYARSSQTATLKTDRMAKSAQGLQAALRGVRNLLGVMGFAYVAREILQTADAQAVLSTRLRTATRDTGDYVEMQRQLFGVSQENAQALSVTVGLFQSLARAAPELEATNEEMVVLTDTVQKLGVIGGSTNEQMKNGLLQFSQGLSAGVLRAEEMNSILENLPELAVRIAAGMDMTVGELRKAVIAGDVLSRDVFDSLIKQAPEIAAEFEEIPITIERGSTMLGNSLSRAIGKLDEGAGTTAAIGGYLASASASVDEMVESISGEEVSRFFDLYIEAVKVTPPALLFRGVTHLYEVFTANARNADIVADMLGQEVELTEVAVASRRLSAESLGLVAKSYENLSEDQVKLLDTLFPLQEAGRAYAEDLASLDEIYGKANRHSAEYQAALDALKKEYLDLFPAVKAEVEAQKERAKEVVRNEEADRDLVDALQAEVNMLSLSAREQAIQTELRKLSIDATDGQKDKVRELTAALYDENLAREQAEQAAEQYAEIWEQSMERVDDSFARLFRSGLDGFEDFGDQLVGTAQDLVAELIYTFAKQQILIPLGFGSTGTGAMSAVPSLTQLAGTGRSMVSTLSSGSSLLSTLGGGLNNGLTSFYTSMYEGAGALGLDGLASAAGNRALDLSVLNGGQTLVNTGLTVGAGLLGGYAGNLVGGSLFDRDPATNGALGAVGGVVGSAWGPLGAGVGAFIGNVLDNAIGGSDFSGKRVKLGVTAGGRQEGGYDFSEVGASGLELGLITRRTDNVGMSSADERAFLDAFLTLDSTLTTLMRSAGYNVDLSGASLFNPTQRRYDGGLAPADMFGSMGKGELTQAELQAAPEEFVWAWITAVSDSMPDAIASQAAALEGSAEELVAGFADLLEFEKIKETVGDLFNARSDVQIFQDNIDALTESFSSITGEVLPRTREQLSVYRWTDGAERCQPGGADGHLCIGSGAERLLRHAGRYRGRDARTERASAGRA